MSLWRNFSRLALNNSGVGITLAAAGNRFSAAHLLVAQPALAAASCSNFHCWTTGGPWKQHHVLPFGQQQQQLRGFFRQGTSEQQQNPQQPCKKHVQDEESKSATTATPPALDEEPAKLGLIARFRKMYKEYWYVLVPVHCVTSVFWFGGFYYASTSGVDVIAILESMGVPEKLVDPVRDSSLGHIAVAYLLYKIATPARYTVTLGGTTVSIKYLVQWGYIKPIPSKAQLVQMYKDKKADVKERIAEKKQDLQDRKKSMMDDLTEQQRPKKAPPPPPPGVPHEK